MPRSGLLPRIPARQRPGFDLNGLPWQDSRQAARVIVAVFCCRFSDGLRDDGVGIGRSRPVDAERVTIPAGAET